MLRAHARIALAGLFVLGFPPVSGHDGVLVTRSVGAGLTIEDTAKVVAYFKDTALVVVSSSRARTFNLRTPGQRDALHTVLRKERARWRAKRPPDYRFLLRVGCFCPGRGWLLMDVRKGQPLRAWDKAGNMAAVSEWNMFSIDGLFDNLERSIDRDASVQIAFDPRWHFPSYVRTVTLPGPDTWTIIEARALRRSTP